VNLPITPLTIAQDLSIKMEFHHRLAKIFSEFIELLQRL
jgi:hypothetical protein